MNYCLLSQQFVNENKKEFLSNKESFEKILAELVDQNYTVIAILGLSTNERHKIHCMQKKDKLKTISVGPTKILYIYMSNEYIKYLLHTYIYHECNQLHLC